MNFTALPPLETLGLNLALPLPSALLLVAYAALAVLAGVRSVRSFGRLAGWRKAVSAGALVLTPLLAASLALSVPMPGEPRPVVIPVLGQLTSLAAALWGGPFAALLVGLANGLSMGVLSSHRLSQAFEFAFPSVLAAYLIQLRYRGALARLLRQPLVAALIGALLLAWPLQIIGAFTADFSPALDSLDRAVAQFWPALLGSAGVVVLPGLALQLLVTRARRLDPRSGAGQEVPPWQKSLNARLIVSMAPVLALIVVVLVGAAAFTSYSVASTLVVEQMGRNAANAGSGIPFFVQEGRSLIRALAQDQQLAAGDPEARQTRLREGLRAIPYFEQLVAFDASRQAVAAYPEADPAVVTLLPGEDALLRAAVEGGAPAEGVSFGSQGAVASFTAPLADPASGKVTGVLLGRTLLRRNPALAPVIGVLQQSVFGSGDGFAIDAQNRILLYPAHPEMEQQLLTLDNAVGISGGPGSAYRQLQPDGTQRLIVLLPVEGQSDWTVVFVEPNRVALTLAVQIALPVLALLVVLIALAAPTGVGLVRAVTRPLEMLARSAEAISEGDLGRPVRVTGEDEIGRLGHAFEQMRVSLKGRLDEQDRLLQVSRAVAANLELFRAIPPILSSALDVTHAASVRVALRRGSNPLQTYAAGEIAASMSALDQSLIDLVEKQGTVVISQIYRASPTLNVSVLPASVRSLAALPLRSDTSFYGVLWLTYDHEHSFEQAELTFLGTLAGQAAVAVANSRLLAEAEEGRRKLETVLSSTTDGLIAVDHNGHVIMLNPAAERYLALRAEQARGRNAREVIGVAELARMLTDFKAPTATFEILGPGGVTLQANTSTIFGHDGSVSGRVTLLRDISPLKELDNIKTVFLRMVSHDLRSPLTYMRGYLSMLPLLGELSDAQRDSIHKINGGIDHISEMTERLLYLSRLKFGDTAELELSLVDVNDLVQEIEDEQRATALDKDITLRIEANGKLPLLMADGMMLHQAISNLVVNALKYTPEGGTVTLRAYQEEGGLVTIGVADTGIGIRSEDQPRLFEAFFRVPQREGETPRPHGTGLGLALVKAIADAHEGSVRVESEFGKGSLFLLTLPVREP